MNPLALMLLEVMLVKKPIGLVTEVTALIVLALTNPEALILLDVRLVKLPLGLVIDVAAATVLALTNPEADMLLEVIFNVENPLELIFPLTITLLVFTTNMLDLAAVDVPLPMMKRSLLFALATLYFPETCCPTPLAVVNMPSAWEECPDASEPDPSAWEVSPDALV